jgi:hypothetical protein
MGAFAPFFITFIFARPILRFIEQMRQLSKFIIVFIVFFSGSKALSQMNQMWNHYSIYNPAAAGVGYHHDFSASVVIPIKDYSAQMLNCNLQRKVLHGAFGLAVYGFASFSLSYSYHISLGDESTLAFGAMLALDQYKMTLPGSVYQSQKPWASGLGTHLRMKGFTFGAGVSTYPFLLREHGRSVVGLTAYSEYNWKIGETMEIIPAMSYTECLEENTQVSLRLKPIKLITIGGTYSTYGFGGIFGLYFKRRHIQLNYGIESRTIKLNGQDTKHAFHSINFRVPFPEKDWEAHKVAGSWH